MKLGLWRAFDWLLYIMPLLLLSIGVATIYSTTLETSKSYLTLNQIIYAFCGLGLMLLATFYDYRNLRNVARPFYVVIVLLLAVVLVFGERIWGAARWIDLGFVQLQPSELAKVGLMILAASLLSSGTQQWGRKLLALLVLAAVPVALIVAQPDLGTTIVIVAVLLSLFFTWPIGRLAKLIFAVIVIAVIPIGWFLLHDYQRERLRVFMDPERDPRGAGYNVVQSMIAVGSGGTYGRGLGYGPQSQLNFLPVSHTDFIFAGWAEATGFAGSVALVVLELAFCGRVYYLVRIAKDPFGQYLAVGFGTMLLVQTAVNVGMNIGLAPVTGIPLPFVSSGGTSLLVSLGMVGVMQSIYLRAQSATRG